MFGFKKLIDRQSPYFSDNRSAGNRSASNSLEDNSSAELSYVDYELVRSRRRKTIALSVKKGKVQVRAPWYVKTSTINAFVRTKQQWLQDKLLQQQTLAAEQNVSFQAGCDVWYLGQRLKLIIEESAKANLVKVAFVETAFDEINKGQMLLTLKNYQQLLANDQEALFAKTRQQVFNFYKSQALEYLPKRLERLASEMGLQYNQLKIRQYKARWGSCDSKGNISLNYLLMMCPDWVIDYVLIHELCHLVHFNHSANFWALVYHHCPKTQQAKQWLKDYGYLIRL